MNFENGLYGFKHDKKYYLMISRNDTSYNVMGKSLLNEIIIMIRENEYKEWLRKFTHLMSISEGQHAHSNDYFMVTQILKKNIEKNDYEGIWSAIFEHCDGSFKKTLDMGYLFVNKPFEKYETLQHYIKIYDNIYILNFDEHLFTMILHGVINNYFIYMPK